MSMKWILDSRSISGMGWNRESRRNKWTDSTGRGLNVHMKWEEWGTPDLLHDRVHSEHSRILRSVHNRRGVDMNIRKVKRPRTASVCHDRSTRLDEKIVLKCWFANSKLFKCLLAAPWQVQWSFIHCWLSLLFYFLIWNGDYTRNECDISIHLILGFKMNIMTSGSSSKMVYHIDSQGGDASWRRQREYTCSLRMEYIDVCTAMNCAVSLEW